MTSARKYGLVLALYVTSRGFSFVIFEGHLAPVDWGVKEGRGSRKWERLRRAVQHLLEVYHPDAVVLQDTSPNGTSRSKSIRLFNATVADMISLRDIPLFAYSRATIGEAFAHLGLPNKHALAEVIAKHIPTLERLVPPPRKAWMTEDARMSIFDAAALALVFFQKAGCATLSGSDDFG